MTKKKASKEKSKKTMTLAKWKQIGKICGYDGTRTASTWGEEADRLRKSCSYKLWKKIAQAFGYPDDFKYHDPKNEVSSVVSGTAMYDGQGWVVKVKGQYRGDENVHRVKNYEVLSERLNGKEAGPGSQFDVTCMINKDGTCTIDKIM